MIRYACSLCSYEGKTRYGFRMHMRNVHGWDKRRLALRLAGSAAVVLGSTSPSAVVGPLKG
jgi:hypothetical protein